jgi:signal transduction histidine kinase
VSGTRVEFVGREVASRTFGRFVTEWVAAGGSPEGLVEGTDCSVEQLLDRDGRISWATYRAIIANARSIWDDEGFVRLGLIVMDSPWARPFTIPARLLYSVKDFYFAMVRPGTDLGIARRMFSCVRFRTYDLGPNRMAMEATLEPGYAPCREFFLITKGSLISIPTLLGFGRSRVEMEEIEGGFRYDIHLPGRGGALAGLRRALLWPFTARAAAREIEEAYAVLHDSHAELEAEVAQRKRIEGERERLIADLEAKNAELELRNAELERFSYTVSHDLKAPLVTISGFVGLLRRDAARGDSESVTRDIGQIQSAAEKMARILNELLELSRVGVENASRETVDLSALAREAVQLVSGAIEARNVTVELDPSMPTVRGDRVRLLEVFQNLIDNAVKFMGEQPAPRIGIGAERSDGEVICSVRDNGIGIAAEHREKIFGLFERLHHDTEGTGIGLALVRRIVEVHGGRIWVESRGEGQGTTFRFSLPCDPVPQNGDAALDPIPR